MYSTSANPTETAQISNTPTFPSASMPTYESTNYLPNQAQFYDGSITQVLQNPALNPELYTYHAGNPASNTLPNELNPAAALNQPQMQDEHEEIIDTSTGLKPEEEQAKFDQGSRSKHTCNF